MLLLVAAGIVCPTVRATPPIPNGSISVLAEERWERWGPYGETLVEEAGRFHLGGELFPINHGIWDFSLDFTRLGEEIRLEGSQVPTPIGRLAVGFGDLAIRRTTSADPILVELEPPVGYRGGSIEHGSDDFRLRAEGGLLTRRVGLFARSRVTTQSTIAQLSAEGSWRRSGRWRFFAGHQEATTQEGEARLLTGLEVGRQPKTGWGWLSQMRVANLTSSRKFGTSLLAGARFSAARLELGTHLRRISPEFQRFGLYRTQRDNEIGARVQGTARTGTNSFWAGALDWSRDLQRRSLTGEREQRIFSRISYQTSLTRTIFARATATYRARSTEDPDSLLVDQDVLGGHAEIGWRTNRSQIALIHTRGMMRDPTDRDQEWHQSRFAGHIRRALTSSWTLELSALTDQRRAPDGHLLSRERRGELRCAWRPDEPMNLWVGVARDRQNADLSVHDRNQWEILGGFDRTLPWDLLLSLEASVYLAHRSGRAETERWSLQIGRSFRFGDRKELLTGSPLEFGTIAGSVFEDTNGDGARQNHEPGVPGQIVKLGSGAEAVSGPDGAYSSDLAAIGSETVTLDVRQLPPPYLVPKNKSRRFSLAPGENGSADFALVRSASVRGRILGRLENGSFVGIPDVLVKIRGNHHDVFTDSDGTFHLGGLTAGEATLEIAAWSLPQRAGLTPPEPLTVTLEAGKVAQCQPFILQLPGIPVLQRFRPM